MTAASNQQPDPVTAVHTHGLSLALRAMRSAKQAARVAGLDPRVLMRAIKMLSADPEKVACQHERIGGVLLSLGAATAIETDLFERTSDETSAQRSERIWRDGYLAAVLGDARTTALTGEDGRRWLAGWDAFVAVLDVHEKMKEATRAAA